MFAFVIRTVQQIIKYKFWVFFHSNGDFATDFSGKKSKVIVTKNEFRKHLIHLLKLHCIFFHIVFNLKNYVVNTEELSN